MKDKLLSYSSLGHIACRYDHCATDLRENSAKLADWPSRVVCFVSKQCESSLSITALALL